MGAKSKPTETLSLAELGVEARAPAPWAHGRLSLRCAAAGQGRSGQIEDDGSAADQLVEWLAVRKLL